MGMMGPLKSEIFRYRRRKQHSLDGSVAGMPPYHGTSSSNGMAADAYVGQAPSHFDLYDPFGPMYDWAQPDYRPPEPWFADLHVQPTPLERITGPEAQPPVVVTDAVRQQIEINRAVRSVSDDEMNSALLDNGAWSRGPTDAEHPWFADEGASQEAVEAAFRAAVPAQAESVAPEPAMDFDPMSAMAGPDPMQCGQGLEALVQEAILQQNPNDLQSESFAQEQMMYDEEMQQLLNPFAMPGFGPG